MDWPIRRTTVPASGRLSANDFTLLATDRGPVPMNIGALIRIDAGAQVPFERVRASLADRLDRVPRLRERLNPPAHGWGRPFWVADDSFSLERHLDTVTDVATDEALHARTAELVCLPLPRDRPLWRATWVSGLPDGSAALVLVVHHVVTDGAGGLALLGALADGATPLASSPGATRPTRRGLLPTLHQTARGLRELGLTSGRPRLAERTAFNVPTGPRRSLSTITRPLRSVVDSAHAHGCTVNDIVVSAVVGAMAGALADRGRRPRQLVVSVPISSRRADSATGLGNATGVVPIRVPTMPDALERLRWVASTMRTHRSVAGSRSEKPRPADARAVGAQPAGSRGTSAGPLGALFRALARAGLFQAFIDRQRLVNTFVTNVRGPVEPLSCFGHRVHSIVPVVVTPGNVAVTFGVLSYAGNIVVSVVADPDVVTDHATLTRRLDEEVQIIIGAPSAVPPGRQPRSQQPPLRR